MVAANDYAFFPHIFSNIIGQCDFQTQNKLRFLCSSVKIEVDELHCSKVCFLIEPMGEPGGQILHPKHTTLEVTSWNNGGYGRVPALCPSRFKGGSQLDLTMGIQPEYVTALRNAQTVSTWSFDLMWDDLWSFEAQRAGTSFHSPLKLLNKATRLDLTVRDLSAPVGAFIPEEVAIPSTIQRLEMRQEGDDLWMARSTLLHNCRSLRFSLDEEDIACEQAAESEQEKTYWRRRFFTSLLRPCVQHLVLRIANEGDATTYFVAVKGQDLHPDLRIDVLTYRKWSQEREDELRNKLVKILPLRVIVRESVRGEDW